MRGPFGVGMRGDGDIGWPTCRRHTYRERQRKGRRKKNGAGPLLPISRLPMHMSTPNVFEVGAEWDTAHTCTRNGRFKRVSRRHANMCKHLHKHNGVVLELDDAHDG